MSTLEELKIGEQFVLAGGAYIKTNMTHKGSDTRYCCNLHSGIMYVFPEDTEVEQSISESEPV